MTFCKIPQEFAKGCIALSIAEGYNMVRHSLSIERKRGEMNMKGFARMTKLSNVGGRADYITNERKQEAILAKSEAVDWKPYQDFEKANQRTATANNEGRELIIALPNEWSELPPAELHARANIIAQTAVGKSTDLQWAVHWNHDRTNLHIHVIFSERQREKSAGRWDRDIYLTEDGKVARKKADRAKNPDGTDKPPVHRKGEEKGGFTAKDKAYTTKGWLADTKDRLKQTFTERWGVNIEKPDYLHQYHEGKGKEAPAIRQKNEVIRAVNRRLEEFASIGGRAELVMLPPIKANMKNRYMVIPHFQEDGALKLTRFQNPKNALDFLQKTEAEWSKNIDIYRQNLNPLEAPERTAEPEPTREPQKAPQSVSEPPKSERTAELPEAPKKPSETILEAVKGIQQALTDYQTANQSLNGCKFWEFGRKKDLEQQKAECRAVYDSHVQTLKDHGVAVSFSFADANYKPELVQAVRERFTPKAEPKQAPRRSLQTTLDEAKQKIAQQRAEQQKPEQERSAVKKKKQREIGE